MKSYDRWHKPPPDSYLPGSATPRPRGRWGFTVFNLEGKEISFKGQKYRSVARATCAMRKFVKQLNMMKEKERVEHDNPKTVS